MILCSKPMVMFSEKQTLQIVANDIVAKIRNLEPNFLCRLWIAGNKRYMRHIAPRYHKTHNKLLFCKNGPIRSVSQALMSSQSIGKNIRFMIAIGIVKNRGNLKIFNIFCFEYVQSPFFLIRKKPETIKNKGMAIPDIVARRKQTGFLFVGGTV